MITHFYVNLVFLNFRRWTNSQNFASFVELPLKLLLLGVIGSNLLSELSCFPPSCSHFYLLFPFPLPLFSSLCSGFVAFLTLFPLGRPYLERKLVSVEGWGSPVKLLATGPWDSPSVGGINLSRFFSDSPPHVPGIPLVSLGSPACRLALFLLSAFCLTSASNIRYFSSTHWQAIARRVAKSWTWLKLAGYSPQGCKELDRTEATVHAHTCILGFVEKPCHLVSSQVLSMCLVLRSTCSSCFMERFWKIQSCVVDNTAIFPEFLS